MSQWSVFRNMSVSQSKRFIAKHSNLNAPNRRKRGQRPDLHRDDFIAFSGDALGGGVREAGLLNVHFSTKATHKGLIFSYL